MTYPLKVLSQLPLLLKGFRKAKGFTQAAMAERLGITQQGYANLEANPATATLQRLFIVLRLLDVEIDFNQAYFINQKPAVYSVEENTSIKKEKTSRSKKIIHRVEPTRKRESW